MNLTRTICAFVLTVLVAGCDQSAPPPEQIVRPVRYQEVRAGGEAQFVTFSGVTRAELETDLSFKVSGTVNRLAAAIGDTVEQGDELAALDATDYEVRLQEANAGLAATEAALRNAQASYQRVRGLYENRNVSKGELEAARAAAESAEAQVRAARQQRTAARLQLSYTRLTAPRSCQVARRYVDLNQNVAAGQSVLQLNCGECQEVVVSVSENYISALRDGMEVEVLISAQDDMVRAGVISEIGVASGQLGGTYSVTVDIRGECEQLRSGMAANVRMALDGGSSDGQVIVPLVAIGEDRDGNFVYVLEPADDGIYTAQRRAVTLGRPTSAGVVIEQGLRPGEKVATAGVRRLVDGQQVRLLGRDTEA